METPSEAKYKPAFAGLNQEQRRFKQKELDREAFSQNRLFRGSACVLLNMWIYTTGEVPIIKGENQEKHLLEPRADLVPVTLQKS